MNYHVINPDLWDRNEYFKHYLDGATSFDITIDLDITNLKNYISNKNYNLYPVLIYLLTNTINKHDYFKYDLLNEDIILWQEMIPEFTTFNNSAKLFSSLQIDMENNFESFLSNYLDLVNKFRDSKTIFPQPDRKNNSFYISMVPWINFKSFTLNFKGNSLKPIITLGKYIEKEKKILIPISVKFNHATVDGYHASVFFETLNNEIEFFIES